jgi:hypothetical protein
MSLYEYPSYNLIKWTSNYRFQALSLAFLTYCRSSLYRVRDLTLTVTTLGNAIVITVPVFFYYSSSSFFFFFFFFNFNFFYLIITTFLKAKIGKQT